MPVIMPDIQPHIRTFEKEGKNQTATALEELHRQGEILGLKSATSNEELEEAIARILQRGTIYVLGTLVVSGAMAFVNVPLTVAGLCFTSALVFMTAYTYWLQTRTKILNPTLLLYGILSSVGLALVALASLIVL